MVAPAAEGIDLFKIAGRSISGWITSVAEKEGIPRSTLGRLVRRIRQLGQIACVPRGSYQRASTMHPAFQECIRRLFLLPTRLSMTALREHTDMQHVATRLSEETGKPVTLPSYDQVRREIHAEAAAQAGGMTLEELERCFYQAIVADYQQAFDDLRRQRPCMLWEQAVAQSGVPQYLVSPDDLKLLLMKAQNRKTPHHRYRTFPSHDKRKTNATVTGAMRETIWEVVGGESK